MRGRAAVIIALALGLLGLSVSSGAQQAGKVYRIGFIVTSTQEEVAHLTKALDEGLRELGYVEGRNIMFE